MSRKNARIYREAARSIAEGEAIYSCNEVDRIEGYSGLVNEYKQLFELGSGGEDNRNVWDLWSEKDNVTKQNIRVLMLCLAAAMEFDGRL